MAVPMAMAPLSVASVPHWCAEVGTWEGTARLEEGHGRTPSPLPRSMWSCGCPGSRGNTDPAAWRGPGTPGRDERRGWAPDGIEHPMGSAQPRRRGAFSYLVGGHGHDPVQVLHQLLEGGSLGWDGVPAIPHHHVPAGRGRRGMSIGILPWDRGSTGSPWPGKVLSQG